MSNQRAAHRGGIENPEETQVQHVMTADMRVMRSDTNHEDHGDNPEDREEWLDSGNGREGASPADRCQN
jgi:hypothetical protein